MKHKGKDIFANKIPIDSITYHLLLFILINHNHMDIARLPLILMLIALALSDNTVSIQCTSCSPNICFQLYGGAFNGYTYPTNSASSCSAAGTYPQTIIFTCSHSQCD